MNQFHGKFKELQGRPEMLPARGIKYASEIQEQLASTKAWWECHQALSLWRHHSAIDVAALVPHARAE